MLEVKSDGTVFFDHTHIEGVGIKLYKDGPKSGQRWLWRIGDDGKAHDEINVTSHWHYDSLEDIIAAWL